jgi:hypothetical protein
MLVRKKEKKKEKLAQTMKPSFELILVVVSPLPSCRRLFHCSINEIKPKIT